MNLETIKTIIKAQTWKQSNEKTAERLGISLQSYLELKDQIKQLNKEEEQEQISPYATGYTQDLDRGTAEYKVESSFQPKTVEEIENLIKLDKTKWKLTKYSVWNCGKEDCWLTSAKVSAIEPTNSVEQFDNFLQTYQPKASTIISTINYEGQKGCLIINKQDAHLNKTNITGSNDIEERFTNFYNKTFSIVKKHFTTSNLEKIIYVLGSDEFNSEFTGTTTHGTPQQNILPYHEGFEKICSHEIDVITLLSSFTSELEVVFIIGNHDTYVGWHLVNWLKTYFRTCTNIKFDTRMIQTKYIKYNNTALCFNHGYVVKPEQLARNFPIEFREEWSSCNNYYIFAGDKHTEMQKTIGGIKFYRLAQVSKSKSSWDDEKGYLGKGELTSFFIDEKDGLTDISYRPL